MKAIPIDDAVFGKGWIRADGRAMHPIYLYKVKSPAASHSEWDVFREICLDDRAGRRLPPARQGRLPVREDVSPSPPPLFFFFAPVDADLHSPSIDGRPYGRPMDRVGRDQRSRLQGPPPVSRRLAFGRRGRLGSGDVVSPRRCRSTTPCPARPALGNATRAVLVAPPGAGKTTRVPLALLDEPWAKGSRLIVLEPRRLAARAAAARMAATLGERVGETIGLRVRLQSLVSARTRIEVVTEGVFTRMILDDPALDGVAAVLFDEFHERSLDADLGLALALDAQGGLREDLRLLVMSATLDGARVARLLGDAPLIESEGRAFPVETRYVGRDPQRADRGRGRARDARGARRRERPILVFLPGQGEIRRVAELLEARSGGPTSTSRRSTARWIRAPRTAPSRRRRRAGARSCWRPRSPRPP